MALNLELSHLCRNLLRWFLPNFFLNIKLLFWDRWRKLPELRHLCGHSQPNFGEMTEVVLSQQRSRRFKTHF